MLLPSEIILDADWNARQEYIERDAANEPSDKLSTEQLEISILQRGLLQPPKVRKLPTGQYAAVFGFRRIKASIIVAPDKPIQCSLLQSTGDEAKDDIAARAENLVENLHRESLKPWEVADALYRFKKAHGKITQVRISEITGLTRSYVGNLIRLREKAHPQVWSQFQRWGVSLRIPYGAVLEIVALPRERQLDAWNEYIDGQKTKIRKRSKERKPGPSKLVKYLAATDAIKQSSKFRKGLKLGLAIALGKKKWTFTK